jgi:hypothetical protein
MSNAVLSPTLEASRVLHLPSSGLRVRIKSRLFFNDYCFGRGRFQSIGQQVVPILTDIIQFIVSLVFAHSMSFVCPIKYTTIKILDIEESGIFNFSDKNQDILTK